MASEYRRLGNADNSAKPVARLPRVPPPEGRIAGYVAWRNRRYQPIVSLGTDLSCSASAFDLLIGLSGKIVDIR